MIYVERNETANIWFTSGKITQRLIDFDPFILYSEGFHNYSESLNGTASLNLQSLDNDDDEIYL